MWFIFALGSAVFAALTSILAQIGVDAWEDGDDLFIEGQPDLVIPDDVVFDSKKDHRLAMTWALAGLCGKKRVGVKNFDSVKVSFPAFLAQIAGLSR